VLNIERCPNDASIVGGSLAIVWHHLDGSETVRYVKGLEDPDEVTGVVYQTPNGKMYKEVSGVNMSLETIQHRQRTRFEQDLECVARTLVRCHPTERLAWYAGFAGVAFKHSSGGAKSVIRGTALLMDIDNPDQMKQFLREHCF
jgi:hypothetical protein